ncbi:MAG: chromosome segregation protein SMC [Syntrophales bacterium]|nr:chromosome segregation protein SMC [Syntrophales bacterium]
MRLKSLEISGFKTFRDKVVLEFSPGISGVVGPNGCGKSNIVDALRWVMGEQRVKTLRGKKMDDVIFNGAENSPPLGMAEVTMTMLNDGKPFAGAYGECSEVTVSRRLFREGESEYSINKVPCRMLDVKEFFMDTGVGTKTYSLVEQNSVYTLIEAKPEERRHFIEEAAGIAKYKSRKEAALRKMEATKQNLLRLHDVMKEVKTQLSSVSRQAKRAEQYKALKKEIRELEISLALTSYADLAGNRATLEKQRETLEMKEGEIRTELLAKEASFEEIKISVMEEEEVISQCREQLYGIKNAINMKEQGIEFSRGRIADLTAQRQRDLSDIKVREGALEEIAGEEESLETTAKEREREIQELGCAIFASQGQLEGLRKADRALNEESDEKKIAYIDIVAEKAKLKNMEANLLKFLEDIGRRQDRYLKEIEENTKRCEALRCSLDDLSSGLKSDEEKREEFKGIQDDLTRDLWEAKDQLKEIDDRISSAKEESGSKSARLSSLLEFHEGYSWCGEGIKSIMTARKQGTMKELPGDSVLGLVADHIEVPREYETAVEAVLGEKLQYVVVKSQEDGVRAIDYLKSSSRGRGTFVPLAVRNYSNPSQAEHLRETVRLVEKVRVHDEFKDIVAYLLGDVLLTSSLNAGITLWRQNGFSGTFVTPEGDIINSQGILTGGSNAKGDRGLLANKREIGELKKDISHLVRELADVAEDKKKTSLLIARYEEELQQAKAETHRLEIQINGRRKDLERFEDEIKRISQRRGILEFDHDNLVSEEKDAREKMERAKKDQTVLEEREGLINDELAGLKEKLDGLRKELEQWEREFTSGKVLLAACEEKREADRKTLLRLEANRAALVREISEKRKDVEVSAGQTSELMSKAVEEKEQLAVLYKEYQALEQSLSENSSRQHEREEALRNAEREVKEIKQRLDQVLREANELEMSLRETAFQMDSLKKGVVERHHVDLDSLSGEFAGLEASEQDGMLAKLKKAKVTVETFGEVNLLALNEYEELNVRFDFLTSQNADISASLNSLQHTIERINRISKTRFAETFEAVKVSFREMFARIFPGGKGELYLTDSEDMLETGVEIDIQIPGKRTRNISLLSGGEKSLAAIALIFAILNYRPTPFLVFDEVDAALDDANISLFNKLVRDISDNSQIIIVTHNKKTMEVAENLYGITMQNQGISTVVSVSLN